MVQKMIYAVGINQINKNTLDVMGGKNAQTRHCVATSAAGATINWERVKSLIPGKDRVISGANGWVTGLTATQYQNNLPCPFSYTFGGTNNINLPPVFAKFKDIAATKHAVFAASATTYLSTDDLNRIPDPVLYYRMKMFDNAGKLFTAM